MAEEELGEMAKRLSAGRKAYPDSGSHKPVHVDHLYESGKFADAWLREHPPGDELPFSRERFGQYLREWKRRTGNPKMWNVILSGFQSAGEEATYHLSGVASAGLFGVFVPSGSTVGDVRRFLAWQGIALEAANAEKA